MVFIKSASMTPFGPEQGIDPRELGIEAQEPVAETLDTKHFMITFAATDEDRKIFDVHKDFFRQFYPRNDGKGGIIVEGDADSTKRRHLRRYTEEYPSLSGRLKIEE